MCAISSGTALIIYQKWSGFNEKTVFVPCFLGLLLASPLALANDQHTVSFGYAQTHLSSLKNSDSKDLRGFNFKYRYEFNETWGMLGSFTATRNERENYTWKEGKLHKNGSDSVDYGSLMFGPTYRFNDYVSLYGNAGIATMKFRLC